MDKLVYSTLDGDVCSGCAQPVKACLCRAIKRKTVPKTEGGLNVRFETKGRKGKGVTVIYGLALSEENLIKLAKQLKQRLGTGGTVKDHTIELQGDHRETVRAELKKQGYRL